MQLVKFVMFAALVAACGKSEPTPEEKLAKVQEAIDKELASRPPEPKAPAATPYVSKEGRFTQKMNPGNPVTEVVDDPNGAGQWHGVKWNTRKSVYTVQYIDYKDHANAVAETYGFIATRDESQIKRDEKVKFGAREGREMTVMVNPTTTMYLRFVIDDARVYKVVAGTKVEHDEAKQFLDGFSIN